VKRYLAVAVVVGAMVLGMVAPVLAFSDVKAGASYATEFSVLEEIGVYKGYPDGTDKPNNAITPAEFAAVVIRMLDKERVAGAVGSYETGFSDEAAIADWARGYIIVANSLGIINGYPDGAFRPANQVTYAEAIAMLARALKLDKAATGSWPTNYLVLGADVGLTDGVDPIANLPITRGEMAVMTVDALLSKYEYDEDGGLTETADCLLYTHWEDVYKEYGIGEVSGIYESYLSRSQRIKVSGEYYYLAVDDGDLVADIHVNDLKVYSKGTHSPSYALGFLEEDDEVVLSLKNDEVVEIEATRDTYSDTILTDVDTEEHETFFGDITLKDSGGGDDVLTIDDETTVLLDGKEVTLAKLEDVFNDFDDLYDAGAIVTARTLGDEEGSGEYAIWVSVITKNIVEGEVTAVGNDGDPCIRVDSKKVYYDPDYLTVGVDFRTGDEVTLLRNHDKVAMLVLEAIAEEDDFFGKVVEYSLDRGDLESVTVIKADGTEVTIKHFVDTVTTSPVTNLNKILEVAVDTHGDADLLGTGHMHVLASGLYEDHSSTWIQVDGVKYVRNEHLFVYNGDYIELDDLETTDMVSLYSIDGVVGYVTAQAEGMVLGTTDPNFDNTDPEVWSGVTYVHEVLRLPYTFVGDFDADSMVWEVWADLDLDGTSELIATYTGRDPESGDSAANAGAFEWSYRDQSGLDEGDPADEAAIHAIWASDDDIVPAGTVVELRVELVDSNGAAFVRSVTYTVTAQDVLDASHP